MINIIDFDHGCGGLTAGMERYGQFLTIDNLYLNQNNEKCYNNTHLNPFWTEGHISEDDYDDLDIKVACFSPHVGGNIARRGGRNFDMSEIKREMRWIKVWLPEIAIFSMQPDTIHHLNNRPITQQYTTYKTADGWPIFDKLISFLYDYGYESVSQFTINYKEYNIPQDKRVSFYIAWHNQKKLNLYTPLIKNRKTVINLLEKIKHDIWHQPNFKFKKTCSYIKQGYNASNTNSVSVNSGYNRLFADKICPLLSNRFYLVSDKKPSIHPIYDRPLTIREGATLNGLDSTFTWDSQLSNATVADMIYDSVAPVVGYYLAQSVLELLG